MRISQETPGETPDETPATAAEETIAETLDASPRQPTATIWRIDTDTGEKRWLAQVASEVISESWLARKFGGGKYRVQHKKPDESGARLVFGGQATYDIDPAIRPEPGFEVASGPVMNADGTPAGGSRIDQIMETGIMGLIQQMQNQNQLTLSFVERMTQPQKTGPGLVELLTAVSPLLVPFVELLKNRKDPTDLALQLAAVMKPEPAPVGSGATSATELIAMLEKGMALAGKLGGSATDDASVMSIVNEGLKAVGTIVNGYIEERRATRQVEMSVGNRGDHADGGTAGMAQRPVVAGALGVSDDHGRAAGVNGVGPIQESRGADAGGANGIGGRDSVAGARGPDGVGGMNDRPWIRKARPAFGLLLAASKWMGPDAAAATIDRNLEDEEYEDLYNDILDTTEPGFAGRLVQAFPAARSVDGEWLGEVVRLLLVNYDDEDEGEQSDTAAVGETRMTGDGGPGT